MEREDHIQFLKLGEQQFRLAFTVSFNAALERLPLDVPIVHTFGSHRASWDEFGLRPDQVEYAAPCLEHVATFVMCSAIRQAFADCLPNARQHSDRNVVAAYQASRLIRNAFAHHMLRPVWSIDADCQNQSFEIQDVIRLDTNGLNGKAFQWEDYGEKLAIWRLSQWVRFNALSDTPPAGRKLPEKPSVECYQQGELIMQKIGEAPHC